MPELIDPSILEDVEEAPEQSGVLSVLNCGAGDLKFYFNDPEQAEKAKAVIEDMLKRGYTILVEIDGEWRRATGFDPKTNCYMVTAPPGAPAEAAAETEAAESPKPKRKGRPPKQAVPAQSTKATAIAPTGGG